jgi:hypothetical protein
MSIQALRTAWHAPADTGLERLVLLAIADLAQPDGTGAYPSLELLAERCVVDDLDLVQDAINAHLNRGTLTVQERPGAAPVYSFAVVPV